MSTKPYNISRVGALGAAQTVTASGTLAGVIDTSMADNYVNVEFVATAVSGTTPSLVLTGQWSFDGGVSWSTSDSGGDAWTAFTASGQKMRQHTPKGPLLRFVTTITGTTPSFTLVANVHII